MKQKGDLTKAERLELSILLGKGYSMRAIAATMDRGKSTISYEIAANSTNGIYDPEKAHAKARLRKRMRRLQASKIEDCSELKAFIIERLKAHWNPDEIAGYLRKHRKEYPWYVSKTAIYEWLRTSRGEPYCKYLYSKRRYVKRRKITRERAVIPNRIDISKRFEGADNRTRYGHFESDTVVGKKGTVGGLKVVSERKSRLVLAKKVVSMRPREHATVEKVMFKGMKVTSVTRDNGIENRDHEKVGIPSFFCRPYASWQKGSIENANKMLRRYFPKGTDFSNVSQEEIDRAVMLINDKPRKILGYRSAREVAQKAGILKSIKSESVLIQG